MWANSLLFFFFFLLDEGDGKKKGKRKEGAIYFANLGERNPRLDVMCKYLQQRVVLAKWY